MSSGTSSSPDRGGSSGADAAERLYKVAFDLPEEIAAWAPGTTERLWTGKTSVRMEVQVRNTPFYVKGIAFGDVVRVRPDQERRELVFDDFVSESGHSTVRVVLSDEGVRDTMTDLLNDFGCSWEIDTTGLLWAIDVPPNVDYESMRADLLRIKDEGRIGVEEAALARAHRGSEGT